MVRISLNMFLNSFKTLAKFKLEIYSKPTNHSIDGKNFFEYVLEFIQNISKIQIGEEYGSWVPFIGITYLFIFVSNWSEALLT